MSAPAEPRTAAPDPASTPAPSFDERKLELERERLALDRSFARKWLPTLATLAVTLIASLFGFLQYRGSMEATERTRLEAKAKDEREWGFKVVEMYLTRRELFDLTKNAEQATANLRVLAAVAPTAVQGLLNAEQARIPPPESETPSSERIDSLAAVAAVQNAINTSPSAPVATEKRVASTLAYVQFAEGSRDTALRAQAALQQRGFRVPGIEQVAKVPSRLQVRYYRPEQRALAAHLAIDLGRALDLPTTADNAIPVTSAKQLPDGIVEVWLPPAAP